MAQETALKNRTLGEILEDKARKNGAKAFVHFKDEIASYEQMNERANRAANWFLSMGLEKGDKVVILLNNCLEWLYVWLRLAKIGVVAVPLNTHHKGTLLQYSVNHCDARLMVIGKDFIDRIKSIRGGLTTLSTLVVYPNNDGLSDLGLDTIPFPQLLSAPPTSPAADVKCDDDLMILYTTDSTGPSQGVVSPHGQYVWDGEQRARLVSMMPNDVFYCASPLYHIVPLGDMLMSCLIGDASMVVSDRMSTRRFWRDASKYGATVSVVWGSAMRRLYMQPPRDDDADNSLRLLLVPDAPESIHEAFERRFNLTVAEGYGLTEVNPVFACTPEERKIGSCGKAVEDLEVKIFDDNDNELQAGEIGEIVCRPTKPHIMMKEYYKMPEKTLERWRSSWFHTDDYGYQDEEGYFYFVGAKNDGIKYRGENVSPYEVERIINSHSDVVESAVVGVPSDLGGGDVKVLIRVKQGKDVGPERLMQFCEERMASFMVPRYIEFVDEFPKTEAGDILKRDLRTITDKTWDRERVGYKIKPN